MSSVPLEAIGFFEPPLGEEHRHALLNEIRHYLKRGGYVEQLHENDQPIIFAKRSPSNGVNRAKLSSYAVVHLENNFPTLETKIQVFERNKDGFFVEIETSLTASSFLAACVQGVRHSPRLIHRHGCQPVG